MKKFARWALAIGLCLTLLVCGALAADAADIAVQLDGQNLTFTDAVPQVRDQRTFLPFRAVFEAMDAQVDYEGNVITAVRGDKALTMTLDQTTATVTEKGVTLPIQMDVAPYVDPATWRTYVPVRFAAQAFDCVVGWDQAAQTAIIIDTEKLVADLTAGKSYTNLAKINTLGEKYNAGTWDMAADFDAAVNILMRPLLTIDGTMTGTVQGSEKVSADMNMKLDMSGLMVMAAADGNGLTTEDQTMLDALKTDGVDLSMRGDLAAGKLYMNMDMGALGAASGLDPAVWYELDMDALLEGSGYSWSQLMAMDKGMDLSTLLALCIPEPTAVIDDYAAFKAQLEPLFAAFSDEGFGLNTANYSETLADGATVDVYVTLVPAEPDGVSGYELGLSFSGEVEGTPALLRMVIGMTDDGAMTAQIEGGISAFSLAMNLDGIYTPGTAAPVTAPPDGATVVSFLELLAQAQ